MSDLHGGQDRSSHLRDLRNLSVGDLLKGDVLRLSTVQVSVSIKNRVVYEDFSEEIIEFLYCVEVGWV